MMGFLSLVLVLLSCFAVVQACETVRVKAGLNATEGIYSVFASHNGRPAFSGPHGSILHFERRGSPFAKHDWGAQRWLAADGWYIMQGGKHRYGLPTSGSVTDVSRLTGWRMRAGGAGPISFMCTTCVSRPDWASGDDCLSLGAAAAEGCTDNGWTCEAYALKGWCSDGAPVDGKEAYFGDDRKNPETSCCACGGSWNPGADEALLSLETNQQAVADLEAAVAQMHRSLSTAEEALINATKKIGVARKGLGDLQNKTETNERFF